MADPAAALTKKAQNQNYEKGGKIVVITRTTRTPAFWDTTPPPPAPWLPILVIHIRSYVKRKQCKNYKFKKIAKNSNFNLLQWTLHATHFLKLLDQYEMNPSRTVGDTERTLDAGWTDGQTDGRMDRRMDGMKSIYPPNNFVVQGYNKIKPRTGVEK